VVHRQGRLLAEGEQLERGRGAAALEKILKKSLKNTFLQWG